MLQIVLFNTNWHVFGEYLIAITLALAFAIIAGLFIVFIREYNFKHEWIRWLLLVIWIAMLLLFVAFMYATFGPMMFMRWH